MAQVFPCLSNTKIAFTQIVLELSMGAVILTGELIDFRTVISGDFDLWENSFLAP